ncbi:MAG TPA: glycosyltransferase family 39 protein, partial [Chloroflexota bacterium]|nr:glycosyltransferase family 39 protein [Chloroflexota bacterium]
PLHLRWRGAGGEATRQWGEATRQGGEATRQGGEATGQGGSVRQRSQRGAALLTGLLVAVSPIDVYYSQETRMYALLPALALLSLIATVRLLGTGQRRDWLLWTLVNVVGLYVYYYLGLLTAAEALALLGSVVERRQLGRWILAQAAILVLYLPWAALLLGRLGGSSLALPVATAVHLTPAAYLTENWQDFTVGFTVPPGGQALLVIFAVATLAGAIVLGRRSPTLLALLLLSALLPLAGAGAVLLARPFFYPRFILFAAIPIWSLAAIGLTSQRRVWPLAALLVAVILAGNGWTWYHERTTPRVGYAPDDYRVAFTTLAANARPGDLVLGGYPWQAGYVQAYLWKSQLRTAFLPGHVDPRQIDRLVGSGRAWVFDYSPDHRFEGNWLEQNLDSRAQTLVVDQSGDSRVRLFATRGARSTTNTVPEATLGGQIALLSSDVQTPGQLRPGDAVQISLRWQALTTPKSGYTVFVHLLGPDGKVADQHDGPPLNGAFPTDRWTPGEVLVDRYTLTIPPHATAGRYQVEVGMYLPSNGQRLIVGPTPRQDNRIVIASLKVSPR